MLHNYVKNVTRSRGVPFEHFRNLSGGTGGPACMLTSRNDKVKIYPSSFSENPKNNN